MITIDFISRVLKNVDKDDFRHRYYAKSIAVCKNIEETFSDDYPKFLNLDRPNEKKNDKEYRKTVYRNPCKSHKSRIIDKVQKVEQSEDFFINYPVFEGIESKDSLKNYCENGFRGYHSLKNWVFSSATKVYSDDPNAVIAVFDKQPPADERALYKPYPYVFRSEQVLLFEREKLAVLQSEQKNVYYFFDEVAYYEARIVEVRKNEGGRRELTYEISNPVLHYCGTIPVFKVGRYLMEETEDGEQLFKSIFTDTLPYFQTALRRFSDIEVEFIHHIHTKEWQIKAKKCHDCKGQKFTMTTTGKETCKSCGGRGVTTWGALDVIEVDMQTDEWMNGQSNFPFSSPAGVVDRSIEPVKELVLGYQRLIQEAYDAVDMGLLNKIGANQSGIAKEYDRLEFSQKMYAEGRHIIENILMSCYRFIDAQRYTMLGKAGKQLPEVTIPISFDVMSPLVILEELKLAEEAGAGPEIIGQLRIKYSSLVFGADSEQTRTLIDEANLDPMFGYSVSDRMSLFAGGMGSGNSFTEEDFVLGNNFRHLRKLAQDDNKNWWKLDFKQKREVLKRYASDIIANKKTIETTLYEQSERFGGSRQTA